MKSRNLFSCAFLRSFALVFLAAMVAAAMFGACGGPIDGERHAAGTAEASGSVRVGAYEVDLTPPPGYPMGGFGPAAQTAVGVWTHLYAKAIYIEDAAGRNVVLVSTDLWSMPGGLADRVAELIWQRERDAGIAEGARLGRAQLLIAATHTHNSPGNFSTMLTYNLAGSARPFFDEALFDFLAGRIAHAVVVARGRATPAAISLGGSTVAGTMRNRSMEPFRQNDESASILAANASIPPEASCPLTPDTLAVRAVDPALAVLRFDSVSGGPIAVAAFLAVHPTAMGTANLLYSGDIFGVASGKVAAYLGTANPAPPVVAIFNGAEGDISPNWKSRGRYTTLALGDSIAAAIVRARSSAATVAAPDIAYRYEIVDLADTAAAQTDPNRPRAKPWVGQALYGGAEDGYTFFHELGCVEGSGEIPCTRAGRKALLPPGKRLLDSLPATLQKTVKALNGALADAQTTAPIGIYCVGPVALVALPGEPTMVTGVRVRNAVRAGLQRARPQVSRTIVVGLANEYYSYFTTEEEFCLGHYEGASTMFGGNTQRMLEARAGDVASRIAEPSSVEPQYSYDPGPRAEFADESVTVPIPVRVLYDALGTLAEPGGAVPFTNIPCFEWNAERAMVKGDTALDIPAVPRVEIQERGDDGWRPLRAFATIGGGAPFTVAENDRGANIATIAMLSVDKASAWVAAWMPPASAPRDIMLRFCATMPGGARYCSGPFRLKDIDRGLQPLVLRVDTTASTAREVRFQD